jgi:hypothetical protein
MIRSFLHGHNLACYCALPESEEPDRCHAMHGQPYIAMVGYRQAIIWRGSSTTTVGMLVT